jgi:hypothetical protein
MRAARTLAFLLNVSALSISINLVEIANTSLDLVVSLLSSSIVASLVLQYHVSLPPLGQS